jgi:hypothetical protein
MLRRYSKLFLKNLEESKKDLAEGRFVEVKAEDLNEFMNNKKLQIQRKPIKKVCN